MNGGQTRLEPGATAPRWARGRAPRSPPPAEVCRASGPAGLCLLPAAAPPGLLAAPTAPTDPFPRPPPAPPRGTPLPEAGAAGAHPRARPRPPATWRQEASIPAGEKGRDKKSVRSLRAEGLARPRRRPVVKGPSEAGPGRSRASPSRRARPTQAGVGRWTEKEEEQEGLGTAGGKEHAAPERASLREEGKRLLSLSGRTERRQRPTDPEVPAGPTAVAIPTESYVSLPTTPAPRDYNSQKPALGGPRNAWQPWPLPDPEAREYLQRVRQPEPTFENYDSRRALGPQRDGLTEKAHFREMGGSGRAREPSPGRQLCV